MAMPDVNPPPSPVTALDWAIYYARRGWSVVPVRPGEKMPAIPWARLQSTPADEMTIRSWFDAAPDMGVGLVQGRHVGTIVLDFDASSGGMETLASLEAKGLPQSARAFTPGGGVHVVLTHPGVHVPTRKGVLPGMDVRGDGGFVVAAPSVHVNGRRYAWDVDAHPDESPLADVPAWLLASICGPVSASPDAPAAVTRIAAPGTLGIPTERVVDGRETYMRDTIMAVMRDLRDSLGRLPTDAELIEAAWPQYSQRVDFTRPGRGQHEFAAKIRYTLARARAGQIGGFSAEPEEPKPEEPRPTGEAWDEAAPKAAKPNPLWIDADAWDAATIPARPWVVPGYLMRGSVSVLSGQGAGGKSSLVVGWTVALATGEAIGEFAPPAPCIAVNYNVEDDQQEQLRRYSAGLLAVRKAPSDIAGRVIRCGPRTIGTLFQRDPASGRVMATEAMDALETLCMETQADVLICDPLAELHNAEENDNTAMRGIVAAFRGLASRLGIAVMILHHDRKGNNAPGDMDRMRGASAITGAVRVMLTLTTMSQEEADKFGVPPEERRRHFRIDGAKSNYAIAQDAEWWRLTPYAIQNGESIAACLPWSPPSTFDGISMAACVAVLDAIRKGKWGCDVKSGDEWAGRLLTAHDPGPGRTDTQAKAILRAWEGTQLLTRGEPEPTATRNKRRNYKVNDEQFQQMRRDAGQ